MGLNRCSVYPCPPCIYQQFESSICSSKSDNSIEQRGLHRTRNNKQSNLNRYFSETQSSEQKHFPAQPARKKIPKKLCHHGSISHTRFSLLFSLPLGFSSPAFSLTLLSPTFCMSSPTKSVSLSHFTLFSTLFFAPSVSYFFLPFLFLSCLSLASCLSTNSSKIYWHRRKRTDTARQIQITTKQLLYLT